MLAEAEMELKSGGFRRQHQKISPTQQQYPMARRTLRLHRGELTRQFHAFGSCHLRRNFLQQFETFIGKGVRPTAQLLLDVVVMPDLAEVEPGLSELLNLGPRKACQGA